MTLTVSGAEGQSENTRQSYITIHEPVTASFYAIPSMGLPPLEVSFTNTSNGSFETSFWEFGDGATSSETNPSHTYSSLGMYTVTLALSGPGGEDQTQLKVYVVENIFDILFPIVYR